MSDIFKECGRICLFLVSLFGTLASFFALKFSMILIFFCFLIISIVLLVRASLTELWKSTAKTLNTTKQPQKPCKSVCDSERLSLFFTVFHGYLIFLRKRENPQKSLIYKAFCGFFVELLTRFELVTSSLPRTCSTT